MMTNPSGKQELSFSVLLTRREYLAYQSRQTPRHGWLPPVGILVSGMGVWRAAMGARPFSLSLLLMLLGVLIVCYEPLLLPCWRRSRAARAYEDNQALQKAGTYVFTSDTLTVENAWLKGTLPLAAVTAVEQQPEMLCLFFGAELAVLLPARVFEDGQREQLNTWLTNSRQEAQK